MNKKILAIFSILILSIAVLVIQYIFFLQSEIVKAYTSGKPANGHLWNEMACTPDLCIKEGSGVGVGTDNPSKKLDVAGDINSSGTITAATNICIGSGACLSELNNYIGSQSLLYSAHTFNMCSTTPDNSGYGEVLNVGTTSSPVYICKFDASSCPAGISGQPNWTQYQSYSSATTVTCTTVDCWRGNAYDSSCRSSCTATAHVWGNTSSRCSYYVCAPLGGGPYDVCRAGVCNGDYQVGCY